MRGRLRGEVGVVQSQCSVCRYGGRLLETLVSQVAVQGYCYVLVTSATVATNVRVAGDGGRPTAHAAH